MNIDHPLTQLRLDRIRAALTTGPMTLHELAVATASSERTMNTYLAACALPGSCESRPGRSTARANATSQCTRSGAGLMLSSLRASPNGRSTRHSESA